MKVPKEVSQIVFKNKDLFFDIKDFKLNAGQFSSVRPDTFNELIIDTIVVNVPVDEKEITVTGNKVLLNRSVMVEYLKEIKEMFVFNVSVSLIKCTKEEASFKVNMNNADLSTALEAIRKVRKYYRVEQTDFTMDFNGSFDCDEMKKYLENNLSGFVFGNRPKSGKNCLEFFNRKNKFKVYMKHLSQLTNTSCRADVGCLLFNYIKPTFKYQKELFGNEQFHKDGCTRMELTVFDEEYEKWEDRIEKYRYMMLNSPLFSCGVDELLNLLYKDIKSMVVLHEEESGLFIPIRLINSQTRKIISNYIVTGKEIVKRPKVVCGQPIRRRRIPLKITEEKIPKRRRISKKNKEGDPRRRIVVPKNHLFDPEIRHLVKEERIENDTWFLTWLFGMSGIPVHLITFKSFCDPDNHKIQSFLKITGTTLVCKQNSLFSCADDVKIKGCYKFEPSVLRRRCELKEKYEEYSRFGSLRPIETDIRLKQMRREHSGDINYDLEEVFESSVQEFDKEGVYTIMACSRSEESDEVHYGVLLNETLVHVKIDSEELKERVLKSVAKGFWTDNDYFIGYGFKIQFMSYLEAGRMKFYVNPIASELLPWTFGVKKNSVSLNTLKEGSCVFVESVYEYLFRGKKKYLIKCRGIDQIFNSNEIFETLFDDDPKPSWIRIGGRQVTKSRHYESVVVALR